MTGQNTQLLPMLHPYSQSAVTTDWACPRKRYLQYHAGGQGYESPESSLELFLGIIMHDALAGIAKGLPVDQVATMAQQDVYQALVGEYADAYDKEDYAREQACLMEGLIRGFASHVWPRLRQQFPEIVGIERRFEYVHDQTGQMNPTGPYRFAFIPDLLVRDTEGRLAYIEYKTTGSNKDTWVNSWNLNIQLHATALLAERMLGEPIEYVVVQGLYKGYYSQYQRQESIFCYGYLAPGTPPFIKDQWSTEWKKGFNKSAIWRRDGGVKRWIEELPTNILAEQFPQVPPICLNRGLAEAFLRQQTHREEQIRQALMDPSPQALDETFPQHWKECQPSFGKPCGYRTICHGQVLDPLEHGFTVRTKRTDGEAPQEIIKDAVAQ